MRRIVDYLLQGRQLSGWQLSIVGITLAAMVVDGLDIQLLALVAPVILLEWQVDRASFGPAMAAALVGMSIGASCGGWMGDKYGRKMVLTLATIAFGLATIGAAFADSVREMTALRVAGGIGFGAAGPNAIALATEWLPASYRARVVSLLSIGTPLGGMIGAAVLVGLLPVLGWRGSFVLCGVLSLVIAVVMMVCLPESPDFLALRGSRQRAETTKRRASGGSWPFQPEVPAHETGVEPAALPAGSVFSRTNRRLNAGAWLCFFCLAFVSYAFAAWTPVLLTGSGFTLPQALQSSFSFNLSAVVAAIVSGMWVTRIGSRRLIGWSCLAIVACVATIAFALQSADAAPAAYIRWTVMFACGGAGAFAGGSTAAIYTVLAFGYPAACRAAGVGMGMMMGRAGGIASTYSGGSLLSLAGNSTLPFFAILALCAVFALGGALVIDRHILPRRSG
ncbi:MAG: hypothetical protein RL030_1877 [Pseudomonadota bacterium]|jgi:AAHS family 4-hydroxybenzoate transporter-like MFS transporter